MLLLVLVCVSTWAQTPSNYRLQIEDVIRIIVYRENEIASEMPIGPDGNISAPFIGIIRAAGKTVSELQAELEEEYKRRLRLANPRVSVTVMRFRTILATVVGAVRGPGVFAVRPGDSILTLLSRAGNIEPERADLKRAYLRRAGTQELIPIDLYSMLNFADVSQNYAVEDGDELTIPEKPKPTISIIGAVPAPGPMLYREGMTVADALSFARWEIRYRSMLSKTMVLREMPGKPGQYLRIQVDMVRFLKGDSSQNIQLQPGDLVLVPDTKTPDIDRLSNVAASIFYLNRFFTDDFFGFRIFGR